MGVRISLDGNVLTDTPRGWDEAIIKSKRDSVIRGLITTYTTDLQFWGDGFVYLDNILDEDYCQIVEVLIETDDCEAGVWIVEFNGIIQLPQISEYDLDQRIITTKIFDDTFEAKIDNNKSLKAYVNVGTSKNDVNIEAASPIDIKVFNPINSFGVYLATAREMYRVFDCFRFIIDYMTDGQVGFKSDVFSGKYYHWMLVNGKELRLGAGNGEQLEVSFKNLFVELHKKTNLSFSIEPTPSGYSDLFQLRIEETAFFEQDDAIVTLDNVAGILMEFNKQELYSDVDIGSKKFDDDIVLSYPPLNLKAFKKENYTLAGQCNIDKTLNLLSEYVIDTNVIQDVVVNAADKYDKETFLIVTDGAKAIKYKEFDAPVAEGTDTAGTANKLTDSTKTFQSTGAVSVGDMVVNMLTGLTANLDAIDSEIVLSISADIFNNGDPYQIRTQPFNYNHPLTNIEVITRFIGGLPASVIKHLSGGSTSNFKAGNSASTVDTSFPVIYNPFQYNDESTPPFFDTGGNYNPTGDQYTIPQPGLYGFQANTVFQMNGGLGADVIVNGSFTSNANWLVSGGNYNAFDDTFFWEFTQPGDFFRQNIQQRAGSVYVLTFKCFSTNGINMVINGVSVFSPPNSSSTPTTHQVVLDYREVQSPNQFIKWTFDQGKEVEFTNVVMKETTRFDITQSIVRSSSTGIQLQEFEQGFSFAMGLNQFQRNETFITEATFPTFGGEKITVKTTILNIAGSNVKTTIWDDRYNTVTEETDYTTFSTVLVDDGGGDVLPVDPSTFPIYKYKFKKAITFEKFKALKDAPEKAVLFSKQNINHIFGWRNSIDYSRKTGETSWTLRSKTKINGDC